MTIWERKKEKKKKKKKAPPSERNIYLHNGYHVGCYPSNLKLDKWALGEFVI